MKFVIPERVNSNCNVFKLGFTYPLTVYNRYDYQSAIALLSNGSLGKPLQEYYLDRRTLKPNYMYSDIKLEDFKWFAGQQYWFKRQYPMSRFWIVFRTERQRTLALMMLENNLR